jgi:hypothetical protein
VGAGVGAGVVQSLLHVPQLLGQSSFEASKKEHHKVSATSETQSVYLTPEKVSVVPDPGNIKSAQDEEHPEFDVVVVV